MLITWQNENNKVEIAGKDEAVVPSMSILDLEFTPYVKEVSMLH